MSRARNRRRETPIRRVNPSGLVVWVARYTNPEGRRVSAGTFKRKSDAQHAIDTAYEQPLRLDTVGSYFKQWPRLHPRAPRTQATNEHRVSRALDLKVEGRRLRDWPYDELRRRHAHALLDLLLRDQGRSALGATHIIRALSAMSEDAITDDVAEVNPFRGVSVRATDPRVKKAPRQIRVWSFDDMHRFAASGGRWEPMLRVFADCGLRLGEVLPLERSDLASNGQCGEVDCALGIPHLHVRRTSHEGRVIAGTKTDHGEVGAGRVVPVPASTLEIIQRAPRRIDTPLMFPTVTGKLWRERNFYRDVWHPAQAVFARPLIESLGYDHEGTDHKGLRALIAANGFDPRPHEFRHSYVSHMRAAGVYDADLAAITGHTVETMVGRYSHPTGQSFGRVRDIVG
jgi:integrase